MSSLVDMLTNNQTIKTLLIGVALLICWNQWWNSLLGQDERDAGAVGLQRRRPLPGSAVEHGQSGQRRGDTSVPSHVPQLVGVAVDGVVVVQLDSAAHRDSCECFSTGLHEFMKFIVRLVHRETV